MPQHVDGTPRILIEHGKHCTSYWDVSTNELLDRAALDILEARLGYDLIDPLGRDVDRGYYDKYEADANLTDEQIAAMPGGYDLKAQAEKNRKAARRQRAWYEEQSAIVKKAKELTDLVSTIKTEEVPEYRWQHPGRPERVRPAYTRVYSEAWQFLNAITDGQEYGRVELEYPRTPAERVVADEDAEAEA